MGTRYRIYKTIHLTSISHQNPKPRIGSNGVIMTEYEVVAPHPNAEYKFAEFQKGGVVVTWLRPMDEEGATRVRVRERQDSAAPTRKANGRTERKEQAESASPPSPDGEGGAEKMKFVLLAIFVLMVVSMYFLLGCGMPETCKDIGYAVNEGEPRYHEFNDGDGDGIACEDFSRSE